MAASWPDGRAGHHASTWITFEQAVESGAVVVFAGSIRRVETNAMGEELERDIPSVVVPGRPGHRNRRPGIALAERESAAAGQLEAGDQGAGDGHAAVRLTIYRVSVDRRQECRQPAAVGEHRQQRANAAHGVGDLPEPWGGRGRDDRLVRRHLQRDEAGAEQVGDVTDPARATDLRANASRPNCARRASRPAAARICARSSS